jgi:hypothetical protein
MAKPKGAPKTGGRKKGTPNKATADVRDAITQAFERAGGADYLHRLATEDPRTFCTLLGKIIPTQIAGDEDGEPIKHVLEVSWAMRSKDSE